MLDSDILANRSKRTNSYKPNPKLDDLIDRLKSLLEPLQKEQNNQFTQPKYPFSLVVGPPRSGTTLLSQILASTGSFCYPTNFLSRFAYAPMIGSMIQQMLFDPNFRFRKELDDLQYSADLSSDLGKTDFALGVNEFYHFWRRFFPNHDPGYLDEELISQVNVKAMLSEISSIESVFDKPFLSKGKMMQQNISFFAKHIQKLIFIYIKRDPLYTMQSVLLSRRKMYDDDKIWWSVKPTEYSWLKDMDVYHQIAGQVLYITLSIENELKVLPDNRKIICTYDELCRNPKGVLEQLRTLYLAHGYKLSDTLAPIKLEDNNSFRISKNELNKLHGAYEELESNRESSFFGQN